MAREATEVTDSSMEVVILRRLLDARNRVILDLLIENIDLTLELQKVKDKLNEAEAALEERPVSDVRQPL
jgi:regulator of replication initiation timing